MARCPFASWTPLPENWSQPRITPTQIILHSAVSRASSLYGYFSSPGVVLESHFYIDQDGGIEQMLDTEVRADANYQANPRAVSIETWDNGDPDRIVWNQAQFAALARLVRWLSDTHSVPLRSCPSWTATGVGYHSQFPEWSPVRKTCPGLARRPQVPQIIAAVAGSAVLGSRIPDLTPSEEDDMYTDADRDRDDKIAWTLGQMKPQTDRISTVQTAVDRTQWGVLDDSQGLRRMVADLTARVGALQGVIAAGSPTDTATLTAAAERGARAALADLTLTAAPKES